MSSTTEQAKAFLVDFAALAKRGELPWDCRSEPVEQIAALLKTHLSGRSSMTHATISREPWYAAERLSDIGMAIALLSHKKQIQSRYRWDGDVRLHETLDAIIAEYEEGRRDAVETVYVRGELFDAN